jgi:hypothetical protein
MQAGTIPSSAIGSEFENVFWKYAREHLESLLGGVPSSRLRVCHQVQLGASLGSCLGVYLGESGEST